MRVLTTREFHKHLEDAHKQSAVSIYLKEIVYGAIDGIVTTFAVVAGFSGAQAMGSDLRLPALTVLVFGFANLFADAFSMGLGNLLSVRADQDLYKKELNKEIHEINHDPEFEKAETRHILETKGFSTNDANAITNIYAKNKKYWTDFMMKEELEMSNPLGENAFLTGFITMLSFIIFGVIPLVPYVFFMNIVDNPFALSIVLTFIALIAVGILRWKVTTQSFTRAVGETVLIGSISASVAYIVGSFFRL